MAIIYSYPISTDVELADKLLGTTIENQTVLFPISQLINGLGNTAVWGDITGTLTNQIDLRDALNSKVPTSRTLTINNVTYDLSADRSWTIPTGGTITIGTANGLSLSGQVLSLGLSSASANGALSSTDWNTFNGKQAALSGTGLVKSVSGTISYITDSSTNWNTAYNDSIVSIEVTGTTTKTLTLTQQDGGTLTASWADGGGGTIGIGTPANGLSITNDLLYLDLASSSTIGALSSTDWNAFNAKIDSVTASSPLASSGGANPDITIQQSSSSQDGYLSSADWTTFNNKQASGNYITSLTGEATASGPGASSVTLNNASVTAKVLTGVNITGGTIQATDTMLTAFGKLQSQINGVVGGLTYQGAWNASTNTPALASGVGTAGYYYIVSVAGTTNIDGISDWFVGDWIIYNGTAWQQIDNTDSVVSVNGQIGAVSLITDNIAEGTTNLYYLNSRARASLSATAPLVYNNTTGVFTINSAGTSSNGYLSSTDWNTFNNKVPTSRTLTINGVTYDLSANRSWTISPTGLTLTTNGTSGAATLIGSTLNIPQYTSGGGGTGSLEFDSVDLTVWNNGHGNIVSNTSFGDKALRSNNTGTDNSAFGDQALLNTSTANNNTAIGSSALRVCTVQANTAVGAYSMTSTTSGASNVAVGSQSLLANTTGSNNVAIGETSLFYNNGSQNVAIGQGALQLITSGAQNVAVGKFAGLYAETGSSRNVYIGPFSGPSAGVTQNDKLYINNTYGTALIGGDFSARTVTIDGTITSTQFKLSALNTAPASATATGTLGEIRYDANYMYVCVATNTWKRSALTTW